MKGLSGGMFAEHGQGARAALNIRMLEHARVCMATPSTTVLVLVDRLIFSCSTENFTLLLLCHLILYNILDSLLWFQQCS